MSSTTVDLRGELESSELSNQTQALVVLLNHLSTDREVGTLPSLVCQKIIASGTTPPPVRRLAYDVVRLANLNSSDWDLICSSLKADLTGSQVHPEAAEAALVLVPSIPAPNLTAMVVREDFGAALASCMKSEAPQVRAAAIDGLSAAFALPEVLEAVALSPGLVSSSLEWWGTISNAVLDESDDPSAAAFRALYYLVKDETGPRAYTDGGHLRRMLACHVTKHVLYGLVALLQRAATLPRNPQAHIVRLMACCLSIVAEALVDGAGLGAGAWVEPGDAAHEGGGPQQGDSLFGRFGAAAVRPSGALFAWARVEVCRYLHTRTSDMEPLVVAEAGKALLEIAELKTLSLVQALASEDLSASIAASAGVPPDWVSGAVSSLLSLLRRPDAAPVQHDIVAACCEGLAALEPSGRAAAVRELMPLAASLPQGWQRVSAFGQLCRAAVDLDLSERRNAWDGGTLEEDLLLPSILEDRAVKDLLRPHGSEAAKPQAQAEPDTSQDEGSSGRSSMRAKILGVGSSRGSAPIPDPAVAPKAQGSPVCPEAPEELMATLLQTALEHPQAADEPDPVFNADAAAAAAASREKARTALDWVRMALEAARPMQGCLSREPLLPLVPDLWLVEMQRCAAVVRGLLGRWRSSGGPSPGEEREEEDGAEEAAAEEQGGGTGGWRCEAEEARKALQGLLLRVMAELPRAAPSMRPRAMWVLVHNLGLGPREGATWRSVLEALWDLAAAAVKDTARINAFVAAASEGVLPRLGSPAPEQGPLSGAGGDPYGLQLQSVVLCLEHLASLLTVANDAPELTEKPAAALVSTVDDDHREASVLNLARQLNKLAELLLASPRVLGPDMEDSCRRLQRQLIGMQASAAAAEGGETAGVIPASGKGLLREADLDYSEGYPFSQAPGTSRQAASRASKLEQLVRRAVLRAGERAGCTAGAGAGPRRGAPAATAMSRLGSAFRGAQHCEVPSPAEMGASLGGLLPDAPGSAAARAAGAGASGAPWVALTGASDPVQILARHTIDLESNTATIHLRLSNAMPGAELEGVSVCLSVLGPVHPDSKQPNLVWRLPKLDPQETHAWESRLWISGFGRPKLFPRVTLAKGRRESQTVDLGIRCRCYEIPLTDLLKAPPAVPPARSFFQAWDSLPARWEGCAVAFAPGSAQAPAIASALQDCTPFAPVWLSPLDALCGFQGAFQAITWGGEQVALVIMSQLLPLPGSEAPAAGESVLDTGRQVVRLCIRSSWQEVTTAIEEDSAAWVRELFGGLVSHGPEPPPELSPAVLGQRPTALLKAAPAVAPLRSQSGLSHRASEADLLSDQGEANEGGGLAAWELSEEESLVNRASLAEWRRLACA